MEKTILEQILEKIADGFIEVGTDMKMLLKISKPTAEGQVLTAKMVDGELQPVWTEGGASVPVTPDTSANTLVFDTLTNCEYANCVLNYTSGNLDLTGESGYHAISSKPVNFAFICNVSDTQSGMHVSVGDNLDIMQNFDGNSEGILISIGYDGADIISTIFINDRSFNNPVAISLKDKIQITIADSKATIKNATTGESFTTDTSEYLTNPKYLNVVVVGTNPLPIKAI